MCLLCAAGADDPDTRRRAHALHLLSLIERSGALPPEAALRLAGEILALTEKRTPFRCEPVALSKAAVDLHAEEASP